MVPRLVGLAADRNLPAHTKLFYIISLPFQVLMILIILVEYLLYKRLGSRIVKYSKVVDIVLLLIFTADWVLVLVTTLSKLQPTVSSQIKSLFGFIGFSWRTLLATLIVQRWQLKLIPPATALIVATGYVISYSSGGLLFILVSAICQLINITLIIYFEDRVKWKMVWANIQKDKWMQVNNFILNSLPENIMILDLNGEVKFISEYCKGFLKGLETRKFFKSIQDLQLQKQCESDLMSALQVERVTTINGFLTEDNVERNQVLEDILVNIEKSIKNQEMQEKEFRVYNGRLKIEGQKEKSLEVKISFVQHFENYYIILVIRDMTQRDLLITLEETNKYKDQLLASVSHELTAPLNGNINLVESAINSTKVPDSVKEALLVPALRSSKFLLHMINDILDMSQIKEKKLRLVFQLENLKETLRNTVQLVELHAKKKGIDLIIEIDPSIQRMKFCTDHIRLSQIVLNLLNNAIKFTEKGTIKLIVKSIEGDPNLIQITVEDSGIGISQENIGKLFSSFTHIDLEGGQNMNPTGVGLGLNIAYNLALLLGPENRQGITVTSVLNRGSSFTFVIENKHHDQKDPLELSIPKNSNETAAVELAGHAGLKSSPRMQRISSGTSNSIAPIVEKCDSPIVLESNQCTCPKVLVVDDNPFNTMACEVIFGSLEIKCDCVYNGSACIKSLLNREGKLCGENCRQYEVVLMDQEMPEMSGSETVKEVRRLQNQGLLFEEIKIIGCTAHRSDEEVEKFMEAGIDQCIHKPLSAAMIKDILNKSQ